MIPGADHPRPRRGGGYCEHLVACDVCRRVGGDCTHSRCVGNPRHPYTAGPPPPCLASLPRLDRPGLRWRRSLLPGRILRRLTLSAADFCAGLCRSVKLRGDAVQGRCTHGRRRREARCVLAGMNGTAAGGHSPECAATTCCGAACFRARLPPAPVVLSGVEWLVLSISLWLDSFPESAKRVRKSTLGRLALRAAASPPRATVRLFDGTDPRRAAAALANWRGFAASQAYRGSMYRVCLAQSAPHGGGNRRAAPGACTGASAMSRAVPGRCRGAGAVGLGAAHLQPIRIQFSGGQRQRLGMRGGGAAPRFHRLRRNRCRR